jgi:hypothetical protein
LINTRDWVPVVDACANPTCRQAYQHGKGQLFLCEEDAKITWGTARTNTTRAVWLCETCSKQYIVTFDRAQKSVELLAA